TGPDGGENTCLGRSLPVGGRPAQAGVLINIGLDLGFDLDGDSMAENRDEDSPGNRVEPEVEASHGWGDLGVDAQLVGVECVHGEHVAVRGVALRGRGAAEVLAAVVVAYREGAVRQVRAAR